MIQILPEGSLLPPISGLQKCFIFFPQVNPEMENYDVVLVMGANDAVNSAAQERPQSKAKSAPQNEQRPAVP